MEECPYNENQPVLLLLKAPSAGKNVYFKRSAYLIAPTRMMLPFQVHCENSFRVHRCVKPCILNLVKCVTVPESFILSYSGLTLERKQISVHWKPSTISL